MLKTFSVTDIGRKRKVNQDFVYTSESAVGMLPNLFILADGMGGHNAGDYASKTTVEIMVEHIGAAGEKEPARIFREAIQKANELIFRKAGQESTMEGMGTTVVAASYIDGELQVANVGDSRLYLIDDKIKQITRDHSLVEEMVRLGSIGREEARNHPDKNIITRAVGVSKTVEPDFFTVEMKRGDVILMCSDGLTNMLEDEEIFSLLTAAGDMGEKARRLVDAANERGGRDNISVILIEPLE